MLLATSVLFYNHPPSQPERFIFGFVDPYPVCGAGGPALYFGSAMVFVTGGGLKPIDIVNGLYPVDRG